MGRGISWGHLLSERGSARILRSAFIGVLASIPSIIIPYYPTVSLILFAAIEMLVAYRSEMAALSLGLAISLPAAMYQKQVFGLCYFFLIIIPLWATMIFSRLHYRGWLAGILGYVAVLLGWTDISSSLSFLPPAIAGMIFTPGTGFWMGLSAALSVVFLAYAHGGVSYGFIAFPLSSNGFMDFKRPALTYFSPAAFIQPIAGLANFNRIEFEVTMFPLSEMLFNYVQVYFEIASWSIACYLAGRIASRWKRPYPSFASLMGTVGVILVGYLSTGGLAYMTVELAIVGILVPLALAGGIAASGLELVPETPGMATDIWRLFRRRDKAKKVEEPSSQDGEQAPSQPSPMSAPERATDIAELTEAFSKALGLDHEEMEGRKILFDYDPVSEYEKAVRDFCVEALANRGLASIFTRKGSPIYNALSERAAIRFFCLTTQVSVPTEVTRNEVWLPANDVSLMLDALNKTLLANPHATIWFVYDNLTELLVSSGFERTFGFLRYATEILAQQRISAIFLFNSKAHDDKIAASIKGLFGNYVECGREGLRLVRFSRGQQ
jgi:hypothetical protein